MSIHALPPSQKDWPSHGVVSLWDMIQIQLEHYVTLGKNLATLKRFIDEAPKGATAGLTREGASVVWSVPEAIVAVVGQLESACSSLGLATAKATIHAVMRRGLSDTSQIDVLTEVVQQEMQSRLFLHIPIERAGYWENADCLAETTRSAFPTATQEIRSAGTAYACGLWNASVFHSMRAAEDGLGVICDEIGVERSGAEQWGNLIERVEKKLAEIAKLPKSSDEKRNSFQPLSELVIDLRLFKDAWRNQNSHTIAAYNDGNAHSIIHAVCRVLDALAARGGVSGRRPA